MSLYVRLLDESKNPCTKRKPIGEWRTQIRDGIVSFSNEHEVYFEAADDSYCAFYVELFDLDTDDRHIFQLFPGWAVGIGDIPSFDRWSIVISSDRSAA